MTKSNLLFLIFQHYQIMHIEFIISDAVLYFVAQIIISNTLAQYNN